MSSGPSNGVVSGTGPTEASVTSDPAQQHLVSSDQGKRQQIMSAAVDVFSRKGYHGTRMEEVADLAGVAKGTVYLYFPSKEALLREIVRAAVETYVSDIEAIARGGGGRSHASATDEGIGNARDERGRNCQEPAEIRPNKSKVTATDGGYIADSVRAKLERIVRYSLDLARQNRPMAKVVMESIPGLADEIVRWFGSVRKSIVDAVARLIAEGIRRGEFVDTDPRLAAVAFLGAMRALVASVFMNCQADNLDLEGEFEGAIGSPEHHEHHVAGSQGRREGEPREDYCINNLSRFLVNLFCEGISQGCQRTP
ncbi:MAG TPA: TetR/AcrR family transcriptional regulator [Clostridia bacterium]|nr:TetR/AcrR family transcriptional regulator [Clostridia bacterium]